MQGRQTRWSGEEKHTTFSPVRGDMSPGFLTQLALHTVVCSVEAASGECVQASSKLK